MQRYGGDLFQTMFMTLGNLRGILHRGVGNYLDYLARQPRSAAPRSAHRQTWTARSAARAVQAAGGRASSASSRTTRSTRTTTRRRRQSDYGENLHMLLDFLRLRRLRPALWVLRPLVWVHEALVRTFHYDVAAHWRTSTNSFSTRPPTSTCSGWQPWSKHTACGCTRSRIG